jgi:hypothetical protein
MDGAMSTGEGTAASFGGVKFKRHIAKGARSKERQLVTAQKGYVMCRSIKTLHNFEPPATDAEIAASALQFVRKLSGFAHPSKANEAAFDRAVVKVTAAARELLDTLDTKAPPRDRETEAAKARARAADRFG